LNQRLPAKEIYGSMLNAVGKHLEKNKATDLHSRGEVAIKR